MEATEILDSYMKQWNESELDKDNPYEIIIAKSIYKKLCKELKRNVRTYKGHKVIALFND
jgi:hypothetical protein